MEDKSLELIKALKSGACLVKNYSEYDDRKEYLLIHFYQDYKPELSVRGWGAGLGKPDDRLIELIIKPELWEIMDDNCWESMEYPFIKTQMQERLAGKVFKITN